MKLRIKNTSKQGIILRTLIIIFVSSSIISCTETQAQGIHFETGDWAAIQKKAKASNKLIFVDVFTTWCGPCKKMDKTVFTDKEVGAYFNKNFISYKIDAEKGEGIVLSKTYGVMSFPNLMFIDTDGKLVIKNNGYMNANQLLEFGHKVERSEQEMTTMAATYNSGNRTPEFMVKYLAFLKERDLPAEAVAIDYLKGFEKEQWLTVENLKLIKTYVHSPYNPVIVYLAEQRAALENTPIGQQKWIPSILDGVYKRHLKLSIKEKKDPKDIDKLLASYTNLGLSPNAVAYFDFMVKALTTKRDGDWDSYVEHTTVYVNTYLLDQPIALNNYAYGFYKNEYIRDPKALNRALDWINRALQNRMDYNFSDTKATLLYKLRRKEEALTVAKKAVKLAEQNGSDPSGTLKLIKKIKML